MEQFPETTSDIDEYFNKLERASFDPHLKSVIDEAKEYNRLVAELGLSAEGDDEELHEIASALDEQWEMISDSIVRVSGTLERYEAGGIYASKFVDQAELISKGFAFDIHDDTPKLMYMFFEVVEVNGQQVAEPWFADFDKVMIDIDSAMSFDRAEAIVDVNCPELKEQIDEALFETDPDEQIIDAECRALMRLSEVKYTIPAESDAQQIASAIAYYTDDKIEFDSDLPYSISLLGDVCLGNEDGDFDVHDVVIEEAFATGPHVYFIKDIESGISEFMLNCTLHVSRDRRIEGRDVMIPLRSLVDFTPYRDLMLNN